MQQMTASPAAPERHLALAHPVDEVDIRVERRTALRHRHVHELTQLMAERADLRGVNGFADFVDAAVRWSA